MVLIGNFKPAARKNFASENVKFGCGGAYFFPRSSKRWPLFEDWTKVNFAVNESVVKQLDSDEHLPV